MGVEPTSSSDDATAEDLEDRSDRSGRADPDASDPGVGALLDAALDDATGSSPRQHDPGSQARQDSAQAPVSQPRDAETPFLSGGEDLSAKLQVEPSPESGLPPDHPEFQAILRASVLEQIRAHADEYPGIEVCGVLIGAVYENPQTSFVHVDGMIRGEGTSARSTAVTFTAETWEHIHRVMEQKHPDKKIIAWYHTHPGFGIFLSEMDLFIHRHFFAAPWQMAFVFDPQSRESGMFAWRQTQVRQIDYVVDEEKSDQAADATFPSLPYLSPPDEVREEAAPAKRASADELTVRIEELESRVKRLTGGFAIVAAVAIIWPLLVLLALPGAGNGRSATQPAVPSGVPDAKPNDATPVLPLK